LIYVFEAALLLLLFPDQHSQYRRQEISSSALKNNLGSLAKGEWEAKESWRIKKMARGFRDAFSTASKTQKLAKQ
jgi:hypothetical protein